MQTLDVTVLQLHIQRIYHFFQRFYLMCNGKVIIFKCLKRQIQGLQQCVGDNVQFSGSISGEMNALFVQLTGGLHDVKRMISDSLKITDTVQHLGNRAVVVRGDAVLADTYQIGVQLVLILVDLLLVFSNLFLQILVIMEENVNGKLYGFLRKLCHLYSDTVTCFDCNCRCCEKTLIQNDFLLLYFLFFFAVTNQQVRHLFQLLGKGKKQRSCHNVEYRVYQRHACRINGSCHKSKLENPVQKIEHRQNDQSTDTVKADMHCCNTLCILVHADAGHQCCDTGTNVLSHDDGDCHAVCHLSGQRQRL